MQLRHIKEAKGHIHKRKRHNAKNAKHSKLNNLSAGMAPVQLSS